MTIRRAAGPMAFICLLTGALYAALLLLGPSASMSGGFLLIGTAVVGFSGATLFAGLWLDTFFLDNSRDTLCSRVLVGLIFAAGASPLVLGFIFTGFFALFGLLFTLFSSCSFYYGCRLALGASRSVSPARYGIIGGLLALAGIAANAFLLSRFV